MHGEREGSGGIEKQGGFKLYETRRAFLASFLQKQETDTERSHCVS